jgi:EAL and modified HD-GYP domain-containing signal transduction protein
MLVDGVRGGAVQSARSGCAAPAVLARQGIYDTDFRLVAYELLFRPTTGRALTVEDGDAATAEVVLEAFSSIGLDSLVGNKRAFVNVPDTFLMHGLCDALPPERVVLELLEDVHVDDQLIATACDLVERGHTLALDDFVFRAGLEPLLELATIVKLDVLALSAAEVEQHIELVKPYDVTLLAEKVESAAEIEPLRARGFELFQGFALQRPKTVRAQPVEFNRAVLAAVLAATARSDVSPGELVDAIACDPTVVYALLKIINSAYFSLRHEVSSLHQAAALLGVNAIRNWTLMMMISRLSSDDHELFMAALVRARMCELCGRDNAVDPPVAFSAGLLSTLPDVLGEPIEAVLDGLTLSADLRAALIDQQGRLGRLLAWVLAYEDRDQTRLVALAAPSNLINAYVAAVQWAGNVLPELATAS